jgi:hypothetical protein
MQILRPEVVELDISRRWPGVTLSAPENREFPRKSARAPARAPAEDGMRHFRESMQEGERSAGHFTADR